MVDIVDDRNETTIQTSFGVEKALTTSMEEIDRVDIAQRVGVDPENTGDILPVRAGYQYMLARLQASGGALFVGTFDYLILGPFEADGPEGARKALLKKHPVLRTIFVVLSNGDPPTAQIVLKDVDNSNKIGIVSASVSKVSLTSPLPLGVEKGGDDTMACLQVRHAF